MPNSETKPGKKRPLDLKNPVKKKLNILSEKIIGNSSLSIHEKLQTIVNFVKGNSDKASESEVLLELYSKSISKHDIDLVKAFGSSYGAYHAFTQGGSPLVNATLTNNIEVLKAVNIKKDERLLYEEEFDHRYLNEFDRAYLKAVEYGLKDMNEYLPYEAAFTQLGITSKFEPIDFNNFALPQAAINHQAQAQLANAAVLNSQRVLFPATSNEATDDSKLTPSTGASVDNVSEVPIIDSDEEREMDLTEIRSIYDELADI
ncbi:MAG: hypothetical protein K0Q51_1050 [Rickettsiaceae bacterium]|jgi:hypothetical protein|nr:hypothetical protein [Rickettsiaceae bacterium]